MNTPPEPPAADGTGAAGWSSQDSGHGERWSELDRLFERALGLDPKEWPSFLDEVGGKHPELRDALARLLEADRRSSGFLEQSLSDVRPDVVVDAVDWDRQGRSATTEDLPAGSRIGRWTVTRPLGRGGMASVFLAERADRDFDQTVALKLVRRGLDTDDFVRRFVAERQILSSMKHPKIAGLVDGGTTADGRPYLVLEYVDGLPLTEYSDEKRCSVNERLRLFLQVAEAVQYAHANLVVHRDLKPSNILVTAEGQVKLLDFGIAKLLDPDADPATSELTRTGLRPVTPEYASPEQIRGDAITVASDVYQMGVLLYRLLTGERPYTDSRTRHTLPEAILESSPPSPSEAVRSVDAEVARRRGTTPHRLGRRLRGDLDVIILKALRKDPHERYGSAVEMAADIRGHLEGRPIQARRESRWYRTRKFLQRNRWAPPVAAGFAVLVGLYIATLVQHSREVEEERNVAQAVQEAFVGFFSSPEGELGAGRGLGEGRRDLTVREAILEGADRVREDLMDEPAARAQLTSAMANVLLDLDEQGVALELAEEALELNTELYGADSPEVHAALVPLVHLVQDPDSARVVGDRRLQLSRELFGSESPMVAGSLQILGGVEARAGNLEASADHYSEAARLLRPAASSDPQAAVRLAWALGFLSEAQLGLGRGAQALSSAEEAWAIMGRELGADHSTAATHGIKVAMALRGVGDFERAAEVFRVTLATMDQEFGTTHTTTLNSRNNYALLLREMGNYAEAEAVLRELLEARRTKYGPVSLRAAEALQNLARTVMDQGRLLEADSLAATAHQLFMEVRGDSYYPTAFPLLTRSEILLATGDFRTAGDVAAEAARILRGTLPRGHYTIAVAECRLGQALAELGESAEGRRLIDESYRALSDAQTVAATPFLEECGAALQRLGGA